MRLMSAKRSYSGPESGNSVAYAFHGNGDVGSGTIEPIIHLFIDMDRRGGGEFEAGLKAIAEKTP